MDNFEKVEKLRERANVTYEEAKEALEKSNNDILDAMIYLERNGKVSEPKTTQYTTQAEKVNALEATMCQEDEKECFKDKMKSFGEWCMKWIEKGNKNYFHVRRNGEEVFSLPVTILVVLCLFAFWCVVPLLIVGLFFSFRYSFEGPNMHIVDIDINKAMDGAADVAENIKNEFANKENK